MAKVNLSKSKWVPIIGGIAVAGTAAILLYNAIKKGSKLAVYYVSEMDLATAQTVVNQKGATLVRGANIGEGGTVSQALADIVGYDLTLSIGGQITNPLYEYALSQGLVQELLTPGDKEVKRVIINGKNIIFAAGYDDVDTVNAVSEAIALI